MKVGSFSAFAKHKIGPMTDWFPAANVFLLMHWENVALLQTCIFASECFTWGWICGCEPWCLDFPLSSLPVNTTQHDDSRQHFQETEPTFSTEIIQLQFHTSKWSLAHVSSDTLWHGVNGVSQSETGAMFAWCLMFVCSGVVTIHSTVSGCCNTSTTQLLDNKVMMSALKPDLTVGESH